MKFIILLFIISCATTGEKVKNLSIGMDKHEAQKILGSPDGAELKGNVECNIYYNKLISGWSWDKADYEVCFENEKLISYRAIEIREHKPNNSSNIIINNQ